MSTLSKTVRLFLCLAVFPLAKGAYATLVVVARTANGFIVGTNAERNDGTKVCKLNFTAHRILLISGDLTFSGTSQNHTAFFDVTRQVGGALSKPLSDDGVLDNVTDIITKDVQIVRSSLGRPVSYRIVLVSVFGQRQLVSTRSLLYNPGTVEHPQIVDKAIDLHQDTYLDWSLSLEPVVVNERVDISAMRSIMDRDAALYSGKTGYAPPYEILPIDATGVHPSSYFLPCEARAGLEARRAPQG